MPGILRFWAVAKFSAPMKVARKSPSPEKISRSVESEIPKPGAGHVLIKVQASGVCHSDVLTKEGVWSGIQLRLTDHPVFQARRAG
jgi:D-arabinose 1-dehydrogenase-like Zn-dependent alcohol dehydrogenase